MVDALFGPEFDESVFIYIDNLIIISEDFETILKSVERIMERLLEAELKVSREKCEFACSSITYLEHLLDKDGLRPDPERVRAVLEILSAKNVKQWRTVLGMFGWYFLFIENEAEKKIPLVRLLRKETPWKWSDEENEAFKSLKRALTEATVLSRPDFSKTFQYTPMPRNRRS